MSIAPFSAAQVGHAVAPAQQPPAQPLAPAQPAEAPEDIFQYFQAAVAAEDALAAANTSLHNGAVAGNTQTVIQALADGANINHTTTGDGDTALIQASRLGHANTVKALLDRDADMSITNIRGGSAIPVALRYHRQAVLNTFFHHAAKTDRPGILNWLLERNAVNINHTDADGDTALIQASRLGHADTVQTLLDRDADMSITNIRGGSAIPVALRYHRQAVLNTFFHHAARTGRPGIINWLLNHNAVNINHTDANGDTALIHAARNGQAATVQTLLQQGADDSVRNRNGGTALMSAFKRHHQNVLEVFIPHAAAIREPQEPAQAQAAPAVELQPEPPEAHAAPAQADGADQQIEGVPNPHVQDAPEHQIEGIPDRAEAEPEPGNAPGAAAHQA